MAEDETLLATAAVVRSLARGTPAYEQPEFTFSKDPRTCEGITCRVSLPGHSTDAKRSLENELSALAWRIQYLEAKANVFNSQALPDTPNEFTGPASPFGGNNVVRNGNPLPLRPGSGSTRNTHVSDLLAVRANGRIFSEDDLGHLRDHVERQSQEIRSQRNTIANVGEQLREQQEKTAQTFVKVENEDISRLQRELLKHQQANEAFQKALKEIGTIITNVANGDLSHKVQIHAIEMDPEITTFKRTINTMMDQLQVFGSEVSRVAREVGTEGNLGGQAQITGVSGIWKELTENGDCACALQPGGLLTAHSERDGQQPHPSSARDRRGHNRGGERKSRNENSAARAR